MPLATSTRYLTRWAARSDADWEQHLAAARRHAQAGKVWTDRARGRSLGMLFFNPSLRTRTSMELAGAQLGAHVTTLTPGQDAWNLEWEAGAVMDGAAAEHVREAAGVLSRYYDALGVRVFATLSDYEKDRSDALINTFAEAADVPLVSLESAFYHPCQALADAATIQEHFDGPAAGRRFVLAWTYHPKALPMAVPNSALHMAARLGMDVTVARPEGYGLDDGVMEEARRKGAPQGASVRETADLKAAVEDADVIYAKAWGGPLAYTNPEHEKALRQQHRDWRITAEHMAQTSEAIFLHCLPVRRNVVVDDAVLDSPSARHLRQAEYRLYAQKAILEHLWDLRENGKRP